MLQKLKTIYQGKKVFLTGHTGFKGAWLLKILNLLGAEVQGFALEPQDNDNLFNLIKGDHLCDSVIGNVLDRDHLIASIRKFQPDFVFHLAAQPLVRLSYEIPSETFAVNAIGTANLLDGIRQLEKKCYVVLITTDKVYHNHEWIYPYRENDRLGGYDPYSASKACTELVIDSYRNSFFNSKNYNSHQKAIAVGRAGNVIGGGDWASDRLLPDIARALGKQQPIIIRNPKSVRPWQHVLEPLVGYLLLGTNLVKDPVTYSQAYNFGPHGEDALPVEEMVKLSIKEWGNGSYRLPELSEQPHEAGLLKLDITKAFAELGWKPKLNAEKAIKLTIDWYKKFYTEPENIPELTAIQINNFLND